MASNIQIKRSSTTAVPVELLPGELAYSWASGGDKLYVGAKGTDGFGFANEVTVIGGEYFTAKLDHTAGVLTANSAIVTDATNKIDVLNVDNITIDGNAIASTNNNGNIVLTPNGSGNIDASASKITNLSSPTANTDAANKQYVDTTVSDLNLSVDLYYSGDTGTDSLLLTNEVLSFVGGTALSTSVANNSITFSLDDTAVTAGSYGSSTEVPTFTVDAQGRITGASTATISTDLSVAGDAGAENISLLSETLTVAGGTGISTSASLDTITVSGVDATTTTKGVASFNTNNFTVASGAVSTKAVTIGSTSISNGSTSTTLAGLTQLGVGNLSMSNNTLVSTNTNGNITVSPNGAGHVDVDNSLIKNVANPVDPQDATNKQYVDDLAQGLRALPSARAFSSTNLAATYSNGTSGVGATLTSNTNGAFPSIDGVTVSVGENVVVNGQTNKAHNGSYVLTVLGDAGTPWVLTRDELNDEPDEQAGSFEFITSGTTYGDTGWVLTAASSPVVVGTTELTWVQFSGAGSYTAGSGLSINGTEFNVNVDNSSVEISSDSLRIKAAGVTNVMLAGGITNSKLVNSSITFGAETGTSDPVALGETIVFAAGEGINTAVTNNTMTISGEDASDVNKGIASFNATNFAVASGDVTISSLDGGTF